MRFLNGARSRTGRRETAMKRAEAAERKGQELPGKWLDEHPFAATTCPKCGHRWTELDEDDHGWIALDEQTADREARKYWTPSERAGLKALGFLYRASVGFPVRVMTVSMIRAFVQAARKVKEGK
jgi:hypothetical protein